MHRLHRGHFALSTWVLVPTVEPTPLYPHGQRYCAISCVSWSRACRMAGVICDPTTQFGTKRGATQTGWCSVGAAGVGAGVGGLGVAGFGFGGAGDFGGGLSNSQSGRRSSTVCGGGG